MAIDKKQLMECLKAAISLETDVAIQENIIAAYNQNSLSRKPQLYLKREPIQPLKPAEVEYRPSWNNMDGAYCSFFIGCFCLFFSIVGMLAGGFSWIGLACIVACLLAMIPYLWKKKEAANLNTTLQEEYLEALDQYNYNLKNTKKANARTTEQYQSDLSIWQNNENDNIAELRWRLEKTQSLLNRLYSKDFVYGKYRTLPALTSIYEYFVTGRCDELTGPHGAYNIYEDEVRKDTVISQLNTVIDNLEQIKQNQYMLYQQAKEIRDETIRVNQELQQIKGYTIQIMQLSEIQAYYSALTARNTQISAAMSVING